ncbi:pyroglutamylated RF-amide peptide receptor-like [Oculina patagonica]
MSESAGIITTVLVILAIVDVVGNSVVCLIIKRNRDMRNPMNYLLVNLAIADIIYAAFISPRVFYQLPFAYHPDGIGGTILCKFVSGGSVAWTGSACSIVTLVVIAIERYYAVMYPHGGKWNLTKRKLIVIVPVTWTCAFLFNLPLYIVKDVVKTKSGNSCWSLWPESWMGKTYSTTWFVGVFLPLILMIGLYSRLVYALWFKRNDAGQVTQQQQGVMKVRKRVTLMVIAVTAIFGICWGTGQLIYVLLYFISKEIGAILLAIADVMILFNSAVNPFVYALLNQQFREKIKKMICCSLSPRVHPEPQFTDSAENPTHPTHTGGTSSAH